ncbi:MAG: L-seryl-tRNA(Sec) selenium transferase [Acidimicrobiia bacterium]|nr:L-seryl-tRNA(Sec) selenium transferase [Acidimicrobiia bacterium]
MELRDLPKVDELAVRLGRPGPLGMEVARNAIDQARELLKSGEDADPVLIATEILDGIDRHRPRRLINATGVLLHTNLGRAPWSAKAASHAADVSAGYTNLEFDVDAGGRGGRGAFVGRLAAALVGAESGLVVNNNAAALLLALAAIAAPGEVLVSRGELIEIGGSFRLPDLMAASGARLVEVGTTNKTHLDDYRKGEPAAILKVHPSNYRIEGFAVEAGYDELGALAAERGVPFIADVGSGLLDTRTPWLDGPPPTWLGTEPGVRQTLEAGADVVLYSGDKLLGGPQAGIAVGRTDLIERMRRHPLARALRCDGATMAALGETLETYADGSAAQLPFWAMATMASDELAARSRDVIAGTAAVVVDGESIPGAGSVPGETIPSPVIEVAGRAGEWDELVRRGIVGRRDQGSLILDLRTVDPADDRTVQTALAEILD